VARVEISLAGSCLAILRCVAFGFGWGRSFGPESYLDS
jgi:hypothetical protein